MSERGGTMTSETVSWIITVTRARKNSDLALLVTRVPNVYDSRDARIVDSFADVVIYARECGIFRD